MSYFASGIWSAPSRFSPSRKSRRTEEGIVQRNSLDTLHVRVPTELRIDVEEHGHVDRLAFIEPLLLEAETLDLAEIRCDLRWRHAVRRHPDYVLGRRLVRRSVERQRRLAW